MLTHLFAVVVVPSVHQQEPTILLIIVRINELMGSIDISSGALPAACFQLRSPAVLLLLSTRVRVAVSAGALCRRPIQPREGGGAREEPRRDRADEAEGGGRAGEGE